MDKLDKIRLILKKREDDEIYDDQAFSEIVDIVNEPEPPRNLLAVDEDTPEGTLCWFINGEQLRYAVPLKKVLPGGGFSSENDIYIATEAEIFLGIHMRPNPGYQPCDGLVLAVLRDKSVTLSEAGDLNWGTIMLKNCTCNGILMSDVIPVLDFLPVIWKDGHLVADPERLR